jgi:hypothetical protein
VVKERRKTARKVVNEGREEGRMMVTEEWKEGRKEGRWQRKPPFRPSFLKASLPPFLFLSDFFIPPLTSFL